MRGAHAHGTGNGGGGGTAAGQRPAKPSANKNLDKSLPSLPLSAVQETRSPSIVDYYGGRGDSASTPSSKRNGASPMSPPMSGNGMFDIFLLRNSCMCGSMANNNMQQTIISYLPRHSIGIEVVLSLHIIQTYPTPKNFSFQLHSTHVLSHLQRLPQNANQVPAGLKGPALSTNSILLALVLPRISQKPTADLQVQAGHRYLTTIY